MAIAMHSDRIPRVMVYEAVVEAVDSCSFDDDDNDDGDRIDYDDYWFRYRNVRSFRWSVDRHGNCAWWVFLLAYHGAVREARSRPTEGSLPDAGTSVVASLVALDESCGYSSHENCRSVKLPSAQRPETDCPGINKNVNDKI